MRLESFSVEPFRFELPRPLVTASATYRVRDGFELSGVTDGGMRGLGESTPLESFGTESLEQCRELLSRAAGILKHRALPESLADVPGWVDQVPDLDAHPAARHGVELIALDLLAQLGPQPSSRGAESRGISLSKLLNPEARDTVLVNALLSGSSIADLVEDARRAQARGFGTLKIKVGVLSADEDIKRVQAVRARVGSVVRVRIDANGAWTEAEAMAVLSQLADVNVELCEQPVAARNVSGLRRVHAAASVPIAVDESLGIRENIDALFEATNEGRGMDCLVLKPMVLGGILRARDLAVRANALAIRSYVTHSLDGRTAQRAALQLAAALPSGDRASGLSSGNPSADGSISVP